MPNITIHINNTELTCAQGETILQAARRAGIEIPTLCHDDRLSRYGSCGICAVEEEGKHRLLRACSTVAADGMRLLSDTERVRKNRRTLLELLLSDHRGDCRPPCVLACPAETDCQGYVGLIANGEYEAAAELIREKLPLASSIGRVCPHPCEDACRRQMIEEPVSIANLKYFAADKFLFIPLNTRKARKESGKSVGIIGGGAGGLSAAYFLRLKGHEVTIYDKNAEMGGMLRYGIPAYRLPGEILAKEAEAIRQMGVKFVNNIKIGADISFEEIKGSHDAVIISIGAWSSAKTNVLGEDTHGVVGGIDFLRSVREGFSENLKDKKVAVLGAGNTAIDAARTAVRLGAEAHIVYRRTKDEMPAHPAEVKEADEEGVIFLTLLSPIEITQNNGILNLRLQKMRLGEPDKSGRRSPVPLTGFELVLPVHMVVAAIGQSVDLDGLDGIGLGISRRGTILADEKTFQTSIPGVFAIGDAVNKGPGIAVGAIGMARKCADFADDYLNGRELKYEEPILVTQETDALLPDYFLGREITTRSRMPAISPDIRKKGFDEAAPGFSEEQAQSEARRCIECGCAEYFDCGLLKYAREYGANPKKYQGEINIKKTPKEAHPFITRNEEKCILCGLCVRVCGEGAGVSALGLAGRGFDVTVAAGLGTELSDADCVSCGNCVSLCPTGALMERSPSRKTVPLRESLAENICPGCEVGCEIMVAAIGSRAYRVLPRNGALLCEKGKFYYTGPDFANILTAPLINGRPASLSDAWREIRSALKRFKSGEICIAISPSLNDEEIAEALCFAKEFDAKLITFAKKLPPASLAEMIKSPDKERERFANLQAVEKINGLDFLDPSASLPFKALVAFGETPRVNTAGPEFTAISAYKEREADVVMPLRHPLA